MLPNAKNLVDRLIVTRRLRMASEEIPGHPFFRHLNMEDVEAQRVHPPLLHIHGFGPDRSGNVDEKEVPAVVLEEGEIDEFEDFYH
uniref:AGC-kinase C-terminal domain-containing protein n=1 Tax=Caenorhabditis tropicalis TaxID=1561998 RepID=A0A1I7URW7_9PELO